MMRNQGSGMYYGDYKLTLEEVDEYHKLFEVKKQAELQFDEFIKRMVFNDLDTKYGNARRIRFQDVREFQLENGENVLLNISQFLANSDSP